MPALELLERVWKDLQESSKQQGRSVFMVSSLMAISAAAHVPAIVALIAGFMAGSIALVGFGFDSAIEVTSSFAALWRLRWDADEAARERAERRTLRIIGACFAVLAAYVVYEAARSLILGEAPEHSVPGIVIAALSLIVMPLLGSALFRRAS